jgi:hypothetical protein
MFPYRDIYRSHKPANSMVTAVRVRLNRDGDTPIPLSRGGSFTYGNPAHCHTFDRYLPFSKYGKEHPEWYSLRGGKRVGGQFEGQLCLSNPELRQTLLNKVLETIANDKGYAQQHGYSEPRIYEVSMNDNWNRCECDKCKAEEEKYNPSGFTLNLVNWIAAEVAKKHPGLFISTLAYFYNEPPPKGGVKAADNVYIYMCIDDACYSHPFSECTLGSHGEVYDVEAIMNGWMEATDHPFDIWYYPHTKNTQMPNMSIWTMRENARLLADHNTAFVSMMTNVNGHYEALRAYLGFKLYWNPYMSEEEFERHMNEFLQYYYGPSWEKVREYFDLLKAYADEGNHQFCWAQETIELYPFTVDDSNAAGEVPIVPVEQLRDYENVDWSPYYQALTVVVENEIVTKGRPILEAALALAETDEQRKRVDELMIEVDMVGSYSQRKLLNDIAWATASKVFENSCDAAVGAGTMNKTEAKRLIGAFEDYIVDKTLEEYHEYNRKLAQKIYDSGYPTYRSGWDVPENVEALYLDNVPTGSSGKTWYRNNT